VVDARSVLGSNGPAGPGDLLKLQKEEIVAGTDPVAVDAYCVTLHSRKPNRCHGWPDPPAAESARRLREAQRPGDRDLKRRPLRGFELAPLPKRCPLLPRLCEDRRAMSVRVPCLDGLRGISVCLVLLAHLSGTRELTSGARLPELYGLGNLGVRVFFVISGFLITPALLHAERATTDPGAHLVVALSILRVRALRILPAAFLYIG